MLAQRPQRSRHVDPEEVATTSSPMMAAWCNPRADGPVPRKGAVSGTRLKL
jgi:hypothetical protein